jgi:transcriptional regulator with XRE-family HTH domain
MVDVTEGTLVIFAGIIKQALKDKVTTKADLCKTFGISKPTLERWISGESAPHEKLIPVVEMYIKDLRAIAEEDHGT